MQVLITHVNGVDEQKAIEAVKCLGEIGTYDLGTMVFQSDANATDIYHDKKTKDECILLLVKAALEKLELFLVHFDPRVFEVASAACYFLMNKKCCKQFETPILKLFVGDSNGNDIIFELPKTLNENFKLLEICDAEEYSNYSTFIKRICGELFSFLGDTFLQRVSAVQVSFAEIMTPLLMQLLLNYSSSKINTKIVEVVNYFFLMSSERHKLNSLEVKMSMFLNKFAIKVMLNVAECVRVHQQT